MNTRKIRAALRSAAFVPAAAVLLLGLAVAGCSPDEILDVRDPASVGEDLFDNPAAVPSIVNGALASFYSAYSGAGGDSYLSNVANFSDEMRPADTFPTRRRTDRRDQFQIADGNTSDGAYISLHRARRALNEAAEAVQRLAPEEAETLAQLRALEGFTYVALGEAFCSGIPFSRPGEIGEVVNGDATYGGPVPTAAVFDSAMVRFNAALTADPASNIAAIGLARALLNNGLYDEAAAAVAGVPTDYIFAIEHSDNADSQNNPLFALQSNGRYAVADLEGGNGLPFMSANDPRIPWTDAGVGFDRQTPLIIDLRYPLRGSDVPFAGGVEARLIEAEAALNAGQIGTWLGILNDLRANVVDLMADRYDEYRDILPNAYVTRTTLDPLTDPGTADARVDLMFYERAFWLYTTGHRLGDLRRLIRQYGRAQDEVFPTGEYFEGGTYGNDVAMPVDYDEVNNPNYDLTACNVDIP